MTRHKDAAGVTVRGRVVKAAHEVDGRSVFVVAVTTEESIGDERRDVTVRVRVRVGRQAVERARILALGQRVIVTGRLLPPVSAEYVDMAASEIGRSL